MLLILFYAVYTFHFLQTCLKSYLNAECPDWEKTGITKSIFLLLVGKYHAKAENEIVFEAYREFDKMNRGYISSSEFLTAMSSVAPQLVSERGRQIFGAADIYGMDKVSFLRPIMTSFSCMHA